MSRIIVSTTFLKFALLGDAAASGFTGFLTAVASAQLANLLGLPPQIFFWAGLILLPYAILVGLVGNKANIPVSAIWAIIIANVIWVIGSFALLLIEWMQPTILGYVFVVGQALIVFAFAGMQFLCIRNAFHRSEKVTA